MLQLLFGTCSPLFPRIESAVPTFKDNRAAVARATWIPDQWLDRESVHSDVQRSKNTLWSWWIKLFRIYVLEHWQMWYEWHSTQKDLSFLSMHSTWVDLLLAFIQLNDFGVQHFCCAPNPRFWNLTVPALGTTGGKYIRFFVIYGVNTQWMDLSPAQTFIYGIYMVDGKLWVLVRHFFSCYHINSSWPSATYMRRDFQCLFPQRPRYVALISVLISPVPHIWGVTNGSLLASPPNSRRSPASIICPTPHICGASRTPILTRVVWKILNVVTKILVVLPDYRLP